MSGFHTKDGGLGLRLKFSEMELLGLRSNRRPRLGGDGTPVLGVDGRVVFVPNPTGKAWRCLDASPDAPVGFGLYVGKLCSTYVMQRMISGKVVRWKVCSVFDRSLDEAHEMARRMVGVMQNAAEISEPALDEEVGADDESSLFGSPVPVISPSDVGDGFNIEPHVSVKKQPSLSDVESWQREIADARAGMRARIGSRAAAFYAGVHYKTLEAWRKAGMGPTPIKNEPKKGSPARNQHVSYTLEDLDAYLASLRGDSVTRGLKQATAKVQAAADRVDAIAAKKMADESLRRARERARRI